MNWTPEHVVLEKRDWRLGLLLTPKRGKVKTAYTIGVGALGPIPKLRPYFHRPKKRSLFVPPFGLN
jgi:hypothetical protein